MKRPTVIVSGLGRCGSSLTMQMLHACGLSCAGEYPAFEPEESNMLARKCTAEWLRSFDAVKILDPHRGKVPLVNAKVIWIDRDLVQQSVSQLKFACLVGGLPFVDGAAGRILRSLRTERQEALCEYIGLPLLILSFEQAIDDPEEFAAAIRDFLKPDYSLCLAKMTACVRPRTNGAVCQQDVKIEQELCKAATGQESVRALEETA